MSIHGAMTLREKGSPVVAGTSIATSLIRRGAPLRGYLYLGIMIIG
jgi:hypothetical protein